jgi:hypothetical protein
LIDVTLACEDAHSKLVDILTVDDKNRVGNSLWQIWKLMFGHIISFKSQTFVQTFRSLKLNFRRDFEAEVWSVFCC